MHVDRSLCRGRNRTHGLKEWLHLPDVRGLAEQQVLEKFIDLLVIGFRVMADFQSADHDISMKMDQRFGDLRISAISAKTSPVSAMISG